MTHLIIGDIHGCHDELQALLDQAGLSEGDDIIALGERAPQVRPAARQLAEGLEKGFPWKSLPKFIR